MGIIDGSSLRGGQTDSELDSNDLPTAASLAGTGGGRSFKNEFKSANSS
jgi:hypothetical protein